jgi:hypothetical protein
MPDIPTPHAKIGDLVYDRDRDVTAVVTDVRRGRPVLRPLFGGGAAWVPDDLTRIKIEARRGGWSMP